MKIRNFLSGALFCSWAVAFAQKPDYALVPRDSAAQHRAFYLNHTEEVEEYANRLFNQGHFGAALAYYDRLIAVQPSQARFYFERGRCLEELKAIEEALEDYDRALLLNPEFPDALFNRAHLRFQKGLYGFTIADMDKLLALPADKLAATNAIYFIQSNAGVTGAFSMNNRKIHAYRLRAKAKEKTGNTEEAIADYTSAIGEGQQADADLYYARGNLHRLAGRHREAQADFGKALMYDPQHSQAILALGINAGQADKLRLQAIIAEQPENALALAQRGAILLEEENYGAALIDFDSAEYYGYREVALYINRGIAKDKLGRADAAIADFSRALQIKTSAKAYNLRANSYFRKKNYESAIADYTRSLALDASQADIYYNRGIACHYTNRKNEACANLKTAISLGHRAAQAAYDKLCK
ncbi:tetratricopeptide repeat protein [Rhodoflexus sp.]